MRQKGFTEESPVSRRSLIVTLTSSGFVGTSGCSTSVLDNGEQGPSSSPERKPREFRDIRSDIESLYDTINSLQVAENGDLVFDVQEFEEGFDHEKLLEKSRAVQGRFESIESGSISPEVRESLASLATLAELLIRERIFIHQVIAAGLTYERRLFQDEFADAEEAIRHGKEYLDQLSSNGQQIVDAIDSVNHEAVSIKEFDRSAIQNSQSVLVEVAQWTSIIYQSFHHAVIGFQLFESGVDSLSEERIDEATRIYRRASEHFSKGNELLEYAQGRGTRLVHIFPLVGNLRCVLPVYRDSSRQFADSFKAWRSGQEEEAREVARKAISDVDQQMARCEDVDTN